MDKVGTPDVGRELDIQSSARLCNQPLWETLVKLGTLVLIMGLASALFLIILGTSSAESTASSAASIARGKYLVEQVGMCNDCHTEHNDKGELVKEKYLMGSVLPFKPLVPMPVWADKSVSIAGLPGWTDAAATKFLMTGIAFNDLPARPPMPQYRFNRRDAAAVVAYLKSLAPAKLRPVRNN